MDDFWQQFHRLPKAIRDAVATPAALAAVDRLEQTHPGLDLANFVMRVMVKEFPTSELPQKLQAEAKLDAAASREISERLRADVFMKVADYLNLTATTTPPPVTRRPTAPPNLPVAAAPRPAPAAQQTPPPMPPIRPPRQEPPRPLSAPRPPSPPAAPPRPIVSSPRPLKPSPPVGAIAPTQEYSEEEAKEIEQQSARVRNLQTASSSTDFDGIAQRILDQHHLGWPDELMTKRALALIKARLKEIRNSTMTEAMLVRGPKVGGLGLDPDLAKQLVASLDSEAGQLKTRGMVRPPRPIAPPPPVVPPPVAAAQPIGQPPLVRAVPPTGLPPSPKPPAGVTEPPRPSRPITRPADIPAPSPLARPASPPPVAPVVQHPRQTDRPTIADITRPVKTLGPAEEMRSLTLTEWRRLGQGAAESARRLLEKFQSLQRESFALWTAAIAGWRQSEVYQLYLEMGRQSLEQAITIQEVIATRAKNSQTYLSEHEFFVIADLNRQLQY